MACSPTRSGSAPTQEGWPAKGYEIQVNNSQSDWRRTGSVYSYDDVREVYVSDNGWYTQHIIVHEDQVLSGGTIALQGHDPESKVYFRDIMVKALPDS